MHESDGLVVAQGVFTLPLMGTELTGPDRHSADRHSAGRHSAERNNLERNNPEQSSSEHNPLSRDNTDHPDAVAWLHAGSREFIAGPENALLRVLLASCDHDVPAYNPITLYGPSGSGKSHLLFGLVERSRWLHPERSAVALAGADFARLFVRAVELDNVAEFREKLLAARLLAVDGLEEITTHAAAQQELLSLVERCLDRNNQLLMTCRQSPADWSWMPSGLRSRLDGGLSIPLALPAPATQLAMLRTLSSDYGLAFEDEFLPCLAAESAGHLGSCVTFSRLRSAVLRWVVSNRPPAADNLARRSCERGVPRSSDQAAIRSLAKQVAHQFDLKLSDLVGPSRRKSVVRARGVAMYLARSLWNVSLDQIGKQFGERDHTTVLHACRKTEKLVQTDPAWKQVVDKLRLQVGSVTANFEVPAATLEMGMNDRE